MKHTSSQLGAWIRQARGRTIRGDQRVHAPDESRNPARPAQTKHLGQTEKKKMASLEDIVDTVDDVVSPSDFIAKTIEI
jgi:hypothetical protein